MPDYRGKRVLVTGANGFIGAHLVARLLGLGAEVTCLIRSSSDCWRFDALGIAPRVLACDIADTTQLDALLRPFAAQYVFHLAAERDATKLEIADAQNRSACSGVNVMRATASPHLSMFISVGSSAEVPDPGSNHVSSPHGRSKARDFEDLRHLARTRDLSHSHSRTYYVYGPLQSCDKLIPVAIKAAREGQSMSLTGPEIRKRYVYVLDIVNGLLELPDCPARPDKVHLIGGLQQISNREVVEKVASLVGKPIEITPEVFIPRAFDQHDWDMSGAGSTFRVSSGMTSLEDGLRAMIKWEDKAGV